MGGSTSTDTVGSKFAGFNIQTSLLGQVIPLGWGRSRLSCNLIDYVAFTPVPNTTTTSSGGKGGGTSTSTTTYTYTASVMFGICEGPITGIVTVYKDTSTYAGLAAAGLSAALGTATQAPWAYLTSSFPSHALSYPTIAYAYAQDYQLSTSASLSNHGFEINFGIQFNGSDADPKDIVTDFLTSATHGVSGWGANLLDTATTFADYSLYCRASNLLLSPTLDQPIPAGDFIKRIMQQTNSDVFWSEGLLKVKPFGDASVTGNAVTWNPNLSPIYDLQEQDFCGEVKLQIVDQTDAYNYTQIEYLDRSNQYNPSIATANDLDNVIAFGARKENPQQFHDICDSTIARMVAQLRLQRTLYIRDIYNFTLPMDFIALEPMDYVTLTTLVDGMVLNRQLVMIDSIDEDPSGDVLHFVAEGLPGATASAALYADHKGSGYVPTPNANPGSVAPPQIFNAPTALAPLGYEVWAAVSGNNNINWGGAYIWVSFDGTNYTKVGTITSPARYGTLTAILGANADPDTTHTLSVDLTVSNGVLASATNAEADAGATLCLLGTELVSFATATLTAANKYNLTYLRRGMRGSVIASHASGSNFVRLDSSIARISYNAANNGATMSVKFQSYNVYGRQLQLLSACTVYSITLGPLTSLPGTPTGLGAGAAGGTTWSGTLLTMQCNAVTGATSYKFDLYKSDGTTLVRSFISSTPAASYDNVTAASDGIQRSYKLAVTAINAGGNSPTSAQLAITNTAPVALVSPATTSFSDHGSITATAPVSTTDLYGYIVFWSATSGFDPTLTGYRTTGGVLPVDVYPTTAGTYYCKIASYDAWSTNPAFLNLSAQLSFTTTAAGTTPPPPAGGSGCVTTDTPILMADGTTKPAGQIQVGDLLRTQHELTLEWGDFPVVAVSIIHRPVFKAEGYPRASQRHRFWVDGGWKQIETMGIQDGSAKVVKLTVDEAHTYISDGVLSHNAKV